jgi:tagatose 6-phosphate kinase
MILCVTLNPCLDKTLLAPAWKPGDSVRGHSVREVVGGKGNNVARALKRLGRERVRPVTFLGGAVGERCGELLRGDDRFDPIVTRIAAPTREILTVRVEGSDEQTAFFDPDPDVSEAEARALVLSVEAALELGEVRALTLSGSSPSPATNGLFSELIVHARARDVPVFVDTYGPSLKSVWGMWPTSLQVNLREAAMHLGIAKGRPSDGDILKLLDGWSSRGVEVAVVTDGPNRFLANVRGVTYRVRPPAIEPVNPIGSGDCFLAGVVDGYLAGREAEELLRHAVGCAVANALVWDAGAIEVEGVRTLAAEAVVETVSGR